MTPFRETSRTDDDSLAERRRTRLRAAFVSAQRDGLWLALHLRFASLTVIAVWLMAREQGDAALAYSLSVVGLFAASGAVYVWLNTRSGGRRRVAYAFVAIDALLLSAVLVAPNPFEAAAAAPPLLLRGGGFLAYFVLLALVALSYSPGLVLWFGLVASLGWAAAVGAVALDPRVTLADGLSSLQTAEQRMAALLDPWTIDLLAQGQNVLLLLIVSGMLAVVVGRSRRLVFRQAAVERERANLARYFSPTMIDELAESDVPLGRTRRQDVAILFADIVGFTSWAATRPPEKVITLLRDFHVRMEACAFAHRGTIDKYIGDAVMVTFGTPYPAPDDARRAIDCARAMIEAGIAWNRARAAADEPPVRIAVGAHIGPAVLGDVGSERRLDFAVVGDTVNVASRIEGLTRGLGVNLLVSDELLRRARDSGADDKGFFDMGAQLLRGREAPVRVWGYGAVQLRAAGTLAQPV